MDAFAATRLAMGAGFLLVAAASDARTRKVRDLLWISLGSIGLVLITAELVLVSPKDGVAWSLVGCTAILFYAIFFGAPLFDEDGFHRRPRRLILWFVAVALFLYPVSLLVSGTALPSTTLELYSMPAMVVVYQGFYRVRLLHGGSDAKGLIALGLLLPLYPDASPFPLLVPDPIFQQALRLIFPFSLAIWVDAAILALGVPLVLLLVNAVRGDLAFPQALLGYRAPTNAFPRHAWLMEKFDARGERILVLFPKRGGDPAADLERLRAAGIDRVWVTPQIPFMVPLLGGFLLAVLVGNLLIALLGLAG